VLPLFILGLVFLYLFPKIRKPAHQIGRALPYNPSDRIGCSLSDPKKEQAGLEKLFKIVENTPPSKKGRILGACCSQYLKDGKIYNYQGEECVI
jgi:hypothetical protein